MQAGANNPTAAVVGNGRGGILSFGEEEGISSIEGENNTIKDTTKIEDIQAFLNVFESVQPGTVLEVIRCSNLPLVNSSLGRTPTIGKLVKFLKQEKVLPGDFSRTDSDNFQRRTVKLYIKCVKIV